MRSPSLQSIRLPPLTVPLVRFRATLKFKVALNLGLATIFLSILSEVSLQKDKHVYKLSYWQISMNDGSGILGFKKRTVTGMFITF